MARRGPKAGSRRRAGGAARLYTLSEIARRVGISMPTAQKYKRRYQDRIPSQGTGRRQRYPAAAVAVFGRLKTENAARSGRPRSGGRRTPAPAGAGGHLSLAEVARRTGISYPTLLRYLRLHGRSIPRVGRGRRRRFPEAALAVFTELRAESRRGRKAKVGRKSATGTARAATGIDRALTRRIHRLEAMQAALSRQIDQVVELLRQPLQVTIRPGKGR